MCQEVKIQIETADELLTHICKKTALKCKCSNKESCCCSETIKNIVPNKINQVDKELKVNTHNNLSGEFVKEICSKNDVERFFCKTCRRYDFKKSSTHASKCDWTFWGYSINNTSNIKDLMKKHLKSKQHALSLVNKNNENKSSTYVENSAVMTENACFAAHFIATKNLPLRHYQSLVEFTNTISNNAIKEESQIERLGNRHNS